MRSGNPPRRLDRHRRASVVRPGGRAEPKEIPMEKSSKKRSAKKSAALSRNQFCAYRKSNPSVSVVQPTEDGTTDNASCCVDGA